MLKIVSRKFAKATIKDVAEHAGVSITTVSHFINGRKFACSAETAERINEAIRAVHYAPGPSARRARDQATRTIGLCVEHADDISESYDPRRTYHEQLSRAIVREADISAYALLHYPLGVRHGDSAAPFLDGRVDGVLFGSGPCDHRVFDLAEAGLPTVIINRVLSLPEECGAVFIDEQATVASALDHLWELGHRRIAHLAGPIGMNVAGADLGPVAPYLHDRRNVSPGEWFASDSAARRCDAYIGYMRERGQFDPAYMASYGTWGNEPDAFVDEILKRWLALPTPPTAVFCVNDSLAIALNVAARRCNLVVPRDLSIVGVGNRVALDEAVPPITSVEIPAGGLGQEAMLLLLRMLSADDLPLNERRIKLPPTRLQLRASTAPAG